MSKHLFIINPVTPGSAGLDERIRAACGPLGADYEIKFTGYPGHAAEIARQNTAFTHVYACGGDGTLNETLNGLMRRDGAPALACVPCGTGNDFVRCFGGRERFLDITALVNGHEAELDLIEVVTDKTRFVLNIASVGVDADTAGRVERYKWALRWGSKMPYNLGLAATVISGIKRRYISISVDGNKWYGINEERTDKRPSVSLLACCNGQTYGGGFHACPDADPADGQLEFLLVKGVSRFTLGRIIGVYASGRYKEMTRYIQHISGHGLTFEAAKPVCINCDGEIIKAQKAEFRMSERKLKFILP